MIQLFFGVSLGYMRHSQKGPSLVIALLSFRLTNMHLCVHEYPLCKRKHAMNNNNIYLQNTVSGQYPIEEKNH